MAVNFFNFFVLFSLLSSFSFISSLRPLPQDQEDFSLPTCSRIECPSFVVIHTDKDFEIRRYNSAVWMTTAPIDEESLVAASNAGFLQLFAYIQGKNKYKVKIDMTAPVIIEVPPIDGSFNVSFFVPIKNQRDVPPAEGLHVQKWENRYAAVRQFGGFISDSNVVKEAAALQASLAGTEWGQAINKTQASHPASVYTVAGYNSPFEFIDRTNEIWMMFEMEKNHSM